MSNSDSIDVNIVVLRGEINGDATRRELPSGSIVVQFDVRTRVPDGDHAVNIASPVVVVDPSSTVAADIDTGGPVVVIGRVKRRFFRVGGATQSRTEVVADAVIPIRRRKQVARALDAVRADLEVSAAA